MKNLVLHMFQAWLRLRASSPLERVRDKKRREKKRDKETRTVIDFRGKKSSQDSLWELNQVII